MNLPKLHPNDWVAIVSIAYDLVTGIIAVFYGMTMLGVAIIAGGIAIIAAFDYWEDRFYRRGATLTWLDWMHMRDLMSQGHNYEAIVFVLGKAYKLTESEITRLKPEEMSLLLNKLKVQGGAIV